VFVESRRVAYVIIIIIINISDNLFFALDARKENKKGSSLENSKLKLLQEVFQKLELPASLNPRTAALICHWAVLLDLYFFLRFLILYGLGRGDLSLRFVTSCILQK
jgi:hypothetical protein